MELLFVTPKTDKDIVGSELDPIKYSSASLRFRSVHNHYPENCGPKQPLRQGDNPRALELTY